MKILRAILVLALIVSIASGAFSEELKRTGKIAMLEGRARVKRSGEKKWTQARLGMVLNEGDTIKTQANSWMLLNLDGTGETANIEIEEGSQLLFLELTKDEVKGTQQTLLDLAIGEILIKAQKIHSPESKFEVKTPTSVVGVRGTKFSVTVSALEE